jgi:hypothetical protein
MSQQYPPSQYQIAPHQSSRLAASLSSLQVSYSMTQLQSAHQSPELPDIDPEIPTSYS